MFRIPQWGDIDEIVWPEGLDHSGAITIDGSGTGGSGGGSIPVGTIIAYAGNGNVPTGYLECNGSNVSRTGYSTLFNIIGTTYGAGDGSTTFTLPNFTNRFPEGSTTAGTYISAGLPNITGSKNTIWTDGNAATGAFTGTPVIKALGLPNGSGLSVIQPFGFDASRSNSIYGNSDTVQPPALTVRFLIKATATSSGGGSGSGSGIIDVSLTQNGYVVFDNGLIVQWGRAVTTKGSDTINYNITFNTPFMTLLTVEETGTSGSTSVRVERTATQYLANSFMYQGYIAATDSAPDGIFWLAIGI